MLSVSSLLLSSIILFEARVSGRGIDRLLLLLASIPSDSDPSARNTFCRGHGTRARLVLRGDRGGGDRPCRSRTGPSGTGSPNAPRDSSPMICAHGLVQIYLEHPMTVKFFAMNSDEVLASFGWAADSEQARLYTRRLHAAGGHRLVRAGQHRERPARLRNGDDSLLRPPRSRALGGASRLPAGDRLWCVRLGSAHERFQGRAGCAGDRPWAHQPFGVHPPDVPTARASVGWAGWRSSGWWFLQARSSCEAPCWARPPLAVRKAFFSGGTTFWAHFRIFASEPYFGVGPDGFQSAMLSLKNAFNPEDPASAHNVILDWFSTLGLFAFGWLFLLGLLVTRVGRVGHLATEQSSRAWILFVAGVVCRVLDRSVLQRVLGGAPLPLGLERSRALLRGLRPAGLPPGVRPSRVTPVRAGASRARRAPCWRSPCSTWASSTSEAWGSAGRPFAAMSTASSRPSEAHGSSDGGHALCCTPWRSSFSRCVPLVQMDRRMESIAARHAPVCTCSEMNSSTRRFF